MIAFRRAAPPSGILFMTALLLTGVLVLSATIAAAQGTSGQPRPKAKGLPVERDQSLLSLTERAELIVVGKIDRLVSEWTEDKSRIRTRVVLAVDETVKGDPQESSITMFIPGGEVDGVGEWYSHAVRFSHGEEVVVFANRDAAGRLGVTDGPLGKFAVEKEKETGRKFIANIGPLAAFTSQVKENLKILKSTNSEK